MRSRALARPLVALFILLALSRGLSAQQPSLADSAQEVLLEFRYSGVPRAPLLALATADSTFLPVGALFQLLEVEYVLEPGANRAHGYYLPDTASYTIDLASRTATLGKRSVVLAPGSAFARPPELYLTPRALAALFRLDFAVDTRELAVTLSTEQSLPVVVNARRHAMEQRGRRLEVVPEQAPLRFPWRRSALGPGLFQYDLSANGTRGVYMVGAIVGLGAEVAGGDLQLSSDLSTGTHSRTLHTGGHWSYALAESGMRPTRLDVGQAFSNGLINLDLQGVRVSNEPWQPRRVAGTYLVQGQTVPGWDVELFVDGEFYEVARADSLGRATFNLPLRYGTTFVRLRYVGPAGQQSQEERRLQVPFTVLPGGTLEYSFAAGRRTTLHTAVLQATAAYGITPLLTARVGLDRIDDTRQNAHVAAYAAATGRLPGNVLLTGIAAPGKSLGIDLGKVSRIGGTFDIAYSANAHDEIFNPAGFRNRLRLHTFTPASLGGHNIMARLDGESLWEGSTSRTDLQGELAVNFSGLRPSLVYREQRTGAGGASTADRTISLSALLYPGGFAARWPLPQGTLVQTELEFDARNGRLRGTSTAVSARATRYGQLRATITRELHSPVRLDVGFQFQGTHFRSSSTVFGGLGGGYAQTLAGSISYDPLARDMVFSGRESLGQGMARIRPFVDLNGNNRRDPGEEPLKAGYIRLTQALPTVLEDSGHITRVETLAPYTRYTARVDLGEVENPLWAPAFDAFSFISLPDRVRTLDVPFYPTGTVDGIVAQEQPGGPQPVPGLTIRIARPDGRLQASVPTFGDGAFYAGGLPPGQYRIAPDSVQLSLLGVVAVPAFVTFSVSTTGEGSPGGSLQFLLRAVTAVEKEQKAAPPPAQDSARPTAGSQPR